MVNVPLYGNKDEPYMVSFDIYSVSVLKLVDGSYTEIKLAPPRILASNVAKSTVTCKVKLSPNVSFDTPLIIVSHLVNASTIILL